VLAQVQSLDGEVGALAGSLRAEGASQEDTSHGDVSMGDTPQLTPRAEKGREISLPAAVSSAEESPEVVSPGSNTATGEEREAVSPESAPAVVEEHEVVPQRAEDLDGARLVALNMALSGEPREQTDRYLADSFKLSDRAKLLDEVYAAVGG
jgi:hypothetical protein